MTRTLTCSRPPRAPIVASLRAVARLRAGRLIASWFVCFTGIGWAAGADEAPIPQSLEQQLLQEDAGQLARDARRDGDARRGAVLFHQPRATCTKCHTTGRGTSPLGPDLARLEEDVTGRHLVEAVLSPSKNIREGFEPLVIVLDDGKTVTGLLVEERPGSLVVRDVEQLGEPLEIPKENIEDHRVSDQSIMPAGLANQLGDRRNFLDVMAYLIEISEHGPQRALELAPPPRAPDTSGSHLQVYRTIMPQSGPAALAVGLGDDVWVCFDPQRGGVNYAWSGSLDLAPTVERKINEPARVDGRLFYRDNVDRPLRPEDPDRLPSFQFRGYRFLDDAVEVHYQVDDLLVHERLAPLPERLGLVRDMEITGPAGQVWILEDEQASACVDIQPAKREGGAWRIDLDGSPSVTVRMTIRAQEGSLTQDDEE